MKTYGDVEAYLHVSWSLSMQGSGQLHASTTLSPVKNARRYPFDTRLGGPQSRSGRCGEETNLALPGTEPGAYINIDLIRI
jgi:hypothetical protein